MVMDQSVTGIYGSLNNFKLCAENPAISLTQNFADGLREVPDARNDVYVPEFFIDAPPCEVMQKKENQQETSYSEDYDFSDVVLKYINDMLMEENAEEKNCMFQESSEALQAAEKSLYDLIGETYPPLTKENQKQDNPAEAQEPVCNHGFDSSIKSSSNPGLAQNCETDACWPSEPLQTISQDSHSPGNGSSTVVADFVDSPVSTLRVPEIFNDGQSAMQFKKGFEEASKFLPEGGSLLADLPKLFLKKAKTESNEGSVKPENNEYSVEGPRGKKNPHSDYLDGESGKSTKQSAISIEPTVSSEMFDMVLLQCGSELALSDALKSKATRNSQQNGTSKGLNSGKGRGKQRGRTGVVDLRTLLTLCAQSVAANDRRNADELLKQIRQHSSPMGDGMQRISHYFAEALEARLVGSGTDSSTAVITKPISASSILKAYHLFLAACPFVKISNFFSNKTIMHLTEKAEKVHIIDFGILYGFQWPCLIRRLSSRSGGPPKLRITGIDLPIPGFRPAERVVETGHRLANYADTFKVPFEFNAIAKKWDTIQIEDLKIENDELLVVNSVYRFRYLLDETVVVDSPRDRVLTFIRKLNPDVFIQGIVNGAYSSPFFITRFREAFFHYSTMFDMLETTVPREIEERMLIEKEIFAREAMNVIACEGAERIERPESYKQWQVRNMRAGLRLLPLNLEIKKMAMERVFNHYHKDFLIDEDNKWLLLGWKGRILYALSTWAPEC